MYAADPLTTAAGFAPVASTCTIPAATAVAASTFAAIDAAATRATATAATAAIWPWPCLPPGDTTIATTTYAV